MAIVLSRGAQGRRKWGSSPPFRLTARAATHPIGWRMPEPRVSTTNATLNASFAAVRFRNGKDVPSLSISRLANPASVAARAFKARCNGREAPCLPGCPVGLDTRRT